MCTIALGFCIFFRLSLLAFTITIAKLRTVIQPNRKKYKHSCKLHKYIIIPKYSNKITVQFWATGYIPITVRNTAVTGT